MKRKLVLEGEIGCGKTTLIRKILGTDAEKAGGFITARICEKEAVCGFVLAPAEALRKERIDPEEVQKQKYPCFISLSETMPAEEQVFSGHAVPYLKKAASHPFAVLDEIGGVELLEDFFYEELLLFLQADLPWICVLKTEKSAEVMCSRIPLGERYWERYRKIRELLREQKDVQQVYMTGTDDLHAEQMVRDWKERLCWKKMRCRRKGTEKNGCRRLK